MKGTILTIIFISGVASLRLDITPGHLDAGVSGAVFRVMCKSNVPLTHCHFKWRDVYNNEGPLIDLSEGPKTPPTTNYSYSGIGLDKGECGINLNRPTGIQRWAVSCRVRSKDSGWHYDHMTLFAHLKSATSLSTSPRQITVRPGQNVTVTCNSENPLAGCIFRLPDGTFPTFNQNTNLQTQSGSTNSYKYFGSGINRGECGISLYEVTESNNGFLWCQAWKDASDEWRSFALTVAGDPSTPVLEVKTSNYSEGDVLKVTCTVTRALPVANMTWYLGTQVIRQDHVNEAATEPWVWPFQVQTIKQTLQRKLISADAGKELACKIKQVDDAMSELQSSHTITFYKEYAAPDAVELKLESRIFQEGDTLSATCTVRGGYPLAQISWFLGHKNLTQKLVSVKDNVLVETVMEQLQGEDDRKEVKCVVRHPSLSQPVEKTSTINIQYPPQVFQKALEQFNFKIGSPCVATVEIIANPRPNVYWTMDDATVEEGTIDSTGFYEAAFLLKNVNNPNVWVAQLFINDVTLRVLKLTFFLNARNKLGGEYFRCVNFNTTEPADVIEPPKMMLSPLVDYFSVGASINATCTVTRRRPVGTISWMLSNVTLTKGMSQPILFQTDSQKGIHVIVQTVTLQVGEKDDGSQLKCIAGNRQTGLNISVMYPPKKMTPVIELYGFEVGKPGVLSVEIPANPQPGLRWEVGGLLIQEGEVAADKRYHTPQALARTRGKWVAKLFITNITQQDIGSDFVLTARNQAGLRTYRVRLFTSQSVALNTISTTTLEETAPGAMLNSTVAPDSSVVHKYSTMATMKDDGEANKKSDYSTKTTTPIASQEFPQAGKITYRSNSLPPYLSVGNTIAIVVLCLLGSLLYIQLLRRLSQASQGIERAPMCMENVYYNEINGLDRQCNLTLNQQDLLTCD